MAHDRCCLTGRNNKAYPLYSACGRLRGIMKMDISEFNLDANFFGGQFDGLSSRHVNDVRTLSEQFGQISDVHKCLYDNVVHSPEKVEWYEQIDHVCVHRDKFAYAVISRGDAFGSQNQPPQQRHIHDYLLNYVQERKGGLGRSAVVLVLPDALCESFRFVALIGEIFHGLKIYDAVGSFVVKFIVEFVGQTPQLLPPHGDLDGRITVHGERDKCQNRQFPIVEFDVENDHRRNAFADGRNQIQKQVRNKIVGRIRSSIHRSHDISHFFLQVPLKAKLVEVNKNLLRDFDVRLLLDLQVNKTLKLF
mmetsp:Transcript_849/g.1248  ORF Transcript_849/g.1248 Transcript_849/m.1248 type:complete len:306 (-) Transcript_849:869-1786(-)